MVLQVDKKLLIDSFVYIPITNDSGRMGIEFGEEKKIDFVRIDRGQIYTTTSSERKVVANAVIFCYTAHTTPMVDFKVESKIIFDGKEHVIKKVIPIYEPYRRELWSVELEVL